MGTIAYYTSEHTTMSSEKAVKLGLGYAMEGAGPCYATMHPGPDGGSGVAFTFAENLNISKDTAWQKHPNIKGLWIGYDPNNRPAPEDLIRRKPKDGHFVELCDGQEWLVPVARAVDGTSPLPRALKNDGTNWLVGDVKEAFKDYFARACQLWDVMFPDEGEVLGEDRVVTIAGAADLCVIALSINYRVSVAEVSLLELLDTETYTAVCKAVVDYPALEAMVKKNKIAEPQSSAPGNAD